jgi:cystathionine beta-lyase/cystathionine gamma-synthase
MRSEAGRRESRITANINDYTRDQHDLSARYELSFAREYLPIVGLIKPSVYITSSGMAALSTAIFALQRVYGSSITVMVGRHSYYQNIERIMGSFENVILFDETIQSEWEELILVKKPKAIFVDTMCNESNLTVPPIRLMSDYLKRSARDKTYLVIDNSMLATGYPWKDILKLNRGKLEIIGWESLNKYYQFGMDRVTGGVVWGTGKVGQQLFSARMHAGTIMSDFAVTMMPTPNRKIMKIYLERIERNRRLMKELLGQMAREAASPYSFGGAQLVIDVPGQHGYGYYLSLTKKIVLRARKLGVQMSAGTSFGMPHSRIYLTARKTGYAQMFLRLSVGAEDEGEIKLVAEAIKAAI